MEFTQVKHIHVDLAMPRDKKIHNSLIQISVFEDCQNCSDKHLINNRLYCVILTGVWER